jgi:hypothetical protein
MSDIREPSEAYTSSPTLNDNASTIVSPSPKKAKTYPLPESHANQEWDKLREAVLPAQAAKTEQRIPEDGSYDGTGQFFAVSDAPVVAASPASTHLELSKETNNEVGLGLGPQPEPLAPVSPLDGTATPVAESVDGTEPVGVNVGSKRMFQLSKRFSKWDEGHSQCADTAQMLALCQMLGRLLRIRTTSTHSDLTSCTLLMTPFRLLCVPASPMVVS